MYGLLFCSNRVLVSDEFLYENAFTKFPGGGLEWPEGFKNCVEREFLEETGLIVKANELFFINDFFQPSAFDNNTRIVSIYYVVSCNDLSPLKTVNIPYKFPVREHGAQVFRWVSVSELRESNFYFPIDKAVVRKILSK